MIIPDQTKPNLILKSRKTTVLSDKKWHKTFFSQCLEVFTPLLSISMAIGPTYNWQFQKGIFEILILAQDRCAGSSMFYKSINLMAAVAVSSEIFNQEMSVLYLFQLAEEVIIHPDHRLCLIWTMHCVQSPFFDTRFSDILLVHCLTAADQCTFATVLLPIE